MEANERIDDPPAPATFSLGTLFLTMTCVGVAMAAFRVCRDEPVCGIAAAAVFVGAFLTLWFLATQQFHRLRVSVWSLTFGLVILSLEVGLPRVNSRPASPRAQCGNNLKQIGLALLSYHQAYGSFPPAYVADANGKPLYSWRVLILPELDQLNLAKQIQSDEAWDSPNNAKATKVPTALFHCPLDVDPATPSPAMTSYVAVVGPHSAWSGAKPRKISEFKNPGGTILVIEIAHSGIQWAEPRDLYIGQMPLAINPKVGQGISSDHPGGVNAVFVDGSVHFIPDTIKSKTLAELLDLDGCSDPSAY